MKFSLTWLRRHLDTNASVETISKTLTAIGLEVDAIDDKGKSLAPFLVGHVVETTPHPNADRLKVCKVDVGQGPLLNIVCGAPNCHQGMKTVVARPGDIMPDSGKPLKAGQIRGVESQGMLCAEDELGLTDIDCPGIIDLPDDAPVGAKYADYAGFSPVFDINLTPNRPDCAGVRGIARDLAAAGIGTLKLFEVPAISVTSADEQTLSLDTEACPLFIGRVIRNVKNGSSPEWMQQLLKSIGQRPISILVDITNFLTFDCNRPLHIFDLDKLSGVIRVRAAKEGEEFAALNGQSYKLKSGMTVIEDEQGIISLAGIMGGERGKCDETTRNIFIEAAYFDPIRTATTGRVLNISSDARYRFERGIDPDFTSVGADLATRLVLDLCGTAETKIGPLCVSGAVPETRRHIQLSLTKCARHTGVEVSVIRQIEILRALGFEVEQKNEYLHVTTPSWRPDVEGDVDLVEEIIRIHGYDAIPAQSLQREEAVTHTALNSADRRLRMAGRALAEQGLLEAVTWSFMPEKVAAKFGALRDDLALLNPISSDLGVMRPSIIGNLALAAKRNADRGFFDVGLYEVGPVFENALPEGQKMVAAALRVGSGPQHWAQKARAVDAFDAKADALAALAAAGVVTGQLSVTTDAPAYYHPGQSGCLKLGQVVLAYFGSLHPDILTVCDLEGPAVACEIFVGHITESRSTSTAKPLLKLEALQPVNRDFAFILDRSVAAAKVIKTVRDADKELIREVAVFDLYEGKGIDPDKKSLGIRVTLQPKDVALTEAELEKVSSAVQAAILKQCGGVLRK